MNQETVVDKINRAMRENGYPLRFNDVSGIENFLGSEGNIRLQIYEVIEQLYSELMEDVDI